MDGNLPTLLVTSLFLQPVTPPAEAVVPKDRLFGPTR